MDDDDLKRKEESSVGGEVLKLKKAAMAARKPAVEEAGKKRRKKVVKDRLPQWFIDFMIARPYKPFGDIPQHSEWYGTGKAKADKMEYQQALINQFVIKGYADDELEVTDEDDN